jgi:transposase
MKHLTQEAKQAIVEKALNRKETTLSEIASMHNIGFSTLETWLRQYKEGKRSRPSVGSSPASQCARAEQFEHLLATSKLDAVELGAYCRERGLYSFQLQQWKNEFMSNDNQKKQETQSELKALRAENKSLKQDLLRKDRALAETTALLVLKKKADLLFGVREDV